MITPCRRTDAEKKTEIERVSVYRCRGSVDTRLTVYVCVCMDTRSYKERKASGIFDSAGDIRGASARHTRAGTWCERER